MANLEPEIHKNNFSKVKDNEKDVAAGYYHTVVLDRDNKVWTAGWHHQPNKQPNNQPTNLTTDQSTN